MISKKIFFLVVISQSILLLLIAFNLYRKLSAKTLSINPIKKENIAFAPFGGLKHFYEPKAGSIIKDEDYTPSKTATYTINKDSLNERFDYDELKPYGVYRIITIGDSYTYGLYVDTKDNWTELLEDRLNAMDCPLIDKFEVINLAVEGYDTRYEVERYRKRGQKYNPDLVVWFFVDLSRIDERQIPLSEEYFKKLDNSKDHYLPWRTAKKEILERFGADKVLEYQRTSLELFDSYYKGPLVVIPSWRIPKESPEEKILKKFSDRKGGYFTNILQGMPNLDLLFPNDWHPNLKGHRYISEKVFRYLSGDQFFVCR